MSTLLEAGIEIDFSRDDLIQAIVAFNKKWSELAEDRSKVSHRQTTPVLSPMFRTISRELR